MQIESTRPTLKNSAAQFAGDVWVDFVATPHTDDQRMTVAIVRRGLAFLVALGVSATDSTSEASAVVARVTSALVGASGLVASGLVVDGST